LDWDIKASSGINKKLSAIQRELSAESRGISGMKSYLDSAVRKYNSVEKANSQNKVNNKTVGICKVNGISAQQGTSETAFTLGFWKALVEGEISAELLSKSFKNIPLGKGGNLKLFSVEASESLTTGDSLKYKDKNAGNDLDKFFSDLEDDSPILPEQEKKSKKQINSDESWYDQKGTIAEAKAESKIEGSVVDAEISGSSKYAQGSAEVKVITAEAHASAGAGLYVYEKDSNGDLKRIISPSVAAEVGASVAFVDVAASGRIGLGEDNNMLGVYGTGEVKAASAEAKAKVSINSKQVYAGASAEADLVKAEGSAGVSVLGTDVGVNAGVKIGVGAHAEVGYTDGKFKVDVGAAVGLGVDLGFEVDVSGTVSAVKGVAESAWDKVKWW
jgi:hypothetical protein